MQKPPSGVVTQTHLVPMVLHGIKVSQVAPAHSGWGLIVVGDVDVDVDVGVGGGLPAAAAFV